MVQYLDGNEDTLTYDKVILHLYSQADNEGNKLNIYYGIVGNQKGKNMLIRMISIMKNSCK